MSDPMEVPDLPPSLARALPASRARVTSTNTRESQVSIKVLDHDVGVKLTNAARERHVAISYLATRLLRDALDKLVPIDEVQFTR